MFKHMTVFALTATVALGVLTLGAKEPVSLAGSWSVDARHSDAQLITDGTTDYGKTKIDITLGFARVMGGLKIDEADPAQSRLDLHIFPAVSATEAIEEDGNFRNRWLANQANHTMLCFHSKNVTRTSDGRLQTTGDLILVRVDRNVDATPSEAYAGPVYGSPMIHRVSRQVTLVFGPPAADGDAQKQGVVQESASTKVFREDFPQLLKAVTTTYWPPVVQDKTCQVTGAPGEDYHGIPCKGMLLEAPALPEAPHAANAEDVGASPSDFNAIVGERLNILLHMRLTPGAGQQMEGGN